MVCFMIGCLKIQRCQESNSPIGNFQGRPRSRNAVRKPALAAVLACQSGSPNGRPRSMLVSTASHEKSVAANKAGFNEPVLDTFGGGKGILGFSPFQVSWKLATKSKGNQKQLVVIVAPSIIASFANAASTYGQRK